MRYYLFLHFLWQLHIEIPIVFLMHVATYKHVQIGCKVISY